MSGVIRLNNVTKSFGENRGVTNLTLDVPRGSIFGFLGPNGAGKTTTISMIVDLIRPTTGSISVFGKDVSANGVEVRSKIGFLAGDFALDGSLTGKQQLDYFANLRGGVKPSRITELAKRLDCELHRKINTLSRGNQQKIGLISALMTDPELLIFDEPTTGLDPLIQAQFHSILDEHRQAGKTAFISSHILSEVQETCDHVAFIREGVLVSTQNIKDIALKAPKQIRLTTKDRSLVKKLQNLEGYDILSSHGAVHICTYSGKIQALLKLLASFDVEDINVAEADLETIFMKYYGDNNV